MKKRIVITAIVFLSAIIILHSVVRYDNGRTESKISIRDTTVYNIYYRDTIIYNIQKKDSVITDYTLIPAHDTVTLNDTVYVILPLSSYHFGDSLADIYVSGYNVTLDSFLIHRKEIFVTMQKDIIIPPKRLTANIGVSLLNCDGWNILLDGNANFRINEKWSINADVGIVATGNKLLPFAKGGFRYQLGSL